MKALQWEKLRNHLVQSTIWFKLFKKAYHEKEGDSNELLKELKDQNFMALFSKNAATSTSQPGSARSSEVNINKGDGAVKEPPKEVVRFLDRKLSQNFGIFRISI